MNYKLVGGAGYSPHQDAPAYPFIDSHVSVMVAVDDATEENGCLWVVCSRCIQQIIEAYSNVHVVQVDGKHQEILPQNDKGCIRQDIVDSMEWHAVPLKAGQTLFFHSRTPHKSGPNNSNKVSDMSIA